MSVPSTSPASRSVASSDLNADISAVRRFNRFYTRELGLLRKTFLDTPWTLGEMRILFEIAHGDGLTATDIARELDLDAAYLSRLLRRFETTGLISRTPCPSDARQSRLHLTEEGRKQFDPADQRQRSFVSETLAKLSPADRSRLITAMSTVQQVLEERTNTGTDVILREPREGDFGWIVTANAEIYRREHGWTNPFEGLCAQIVADFINKNDPARERCWIAELDGERVGAIMLVTDRDGGGPETARIRLLILDPRARGLKLGSRLVDECIRFSREAGYSRIVLWTHSVLAAARAIYAKAGFRLTGSEPHDSWGEPVTSEFWELDLAGASPGDQ